MHSNSEADPSAYTHGDLISAVWRWQLEADYISSIAEDLPKGALEQACRDLYGDEHASDIQGLIIETIYLPAPRDAAMASTHVPINGFFVN